MNVGQRIRNYRIYHDMTQREFGERVGTCHTVIARIECGQDPKSQLLLRICKVLKVSPNVVLGWEIETEEDALTAIRNIANRFSA